MSDEDPCLRARDGSLPILCQTTAFAKPSKGALDNPPTGQNLEPFGGVGAFHDLTDPAANAGQSITQFRSFMGQLAEYLRCAVRPPPLPDKNNVPDSGSLLPQEPPKVIRQEVDTQQPGRGFARQAKDAKTLALTGRQTRARLALVKRQRAATQAEIATRTGPNPPARQSAPHFPASAR